MDTYTRLQNITRLEDVPMPDALDLMNRSEGVLNLPVLVVGSDATRFLRLVQEYTSGGEDPTRLLAFVQPGEAKWLFLPVVLGAVRGWTPLLYLYAIGSEVELTPLIEKHGAQARAMVIADGASAIGASMHLRAAGRAIASRDMPFGVFGSVALANALAADTLHEPVVVLEPSRNNAIQVLKHVFRPLLESALLET